MKHRLRAIAVGTVSLALLVLGPGPMSQAAPFDPATHYRSVFGDDARALPSVPANEFDHGLVYDGLIAAKTGPCVGGYQVRGVHPVMCTHGPDSIHAHSAPASQASAPFAVCEGDGVSGRRVEVLYIHGSTSRYAQVVEQLRTLAEGVDNIFYESARETGGTRRVRFVTETVSGACRPVVRDVQIADSALNANDWAPLLNAVKALGYTRTDRKYLQFTESAVYCGIGGFAGDTTKGDNNRSNTGPEYARADRNCWSAGVAAHELGHTLGAVNNNAPNGSGLAHCVDEWDVMCYKDGPNTVIRYACTDQAHDQRLDCNHDDYYHTNPPAGSYLANNWNVADSLFLIKDGTTPPNPTTFRLLNQASNSCMDDPGSNTTNGTQLILWSCHANANQKFTQTGPTLTVLGKCVEGSAGKVVITTCTGSTAQQWELLSNATMRNVQSGQCAAPAGGATANNTAIVLMTCGTQTYQRWTKN